MDGASALDLFPDGAFVRLRNRAQQTYLHADEDGEGVSARPHGTSFSLNAVWRVHHIEFDGTTFVRLQGAAYGRYLAIQHGGRGRVSGCVGQRAVQSDHNGPEVDNLVWRPFRTVGDERYVRLRLDDHDRYLRANGRFRFWHTAVTVGTVGVVDVYQGKWSTMMQWTVSRFDLAPGLPPLPLPRVILGAPSGLFRRRRPEADQRRTIKYVLANDEGEFDQNYRNWPAFPFYGRSVFNLMTHVGVRLPDVEVGDGSITLAVRPGYHGRLNPLVTDLPRSGDTMDIVVFKTGTQGAQRFVYPHIL